MLPVPYRDCVRDGSEIDPHPGPVAAVIESMNESCFD